MRTEATPERDAVGGVVGLARALRAAGVDAVPERVHATVCALDALGATSRDGVYWAGRLTLCASRDDVARYDRVFATWFDRTAVESGTAADLAGPAPRRLLVAVDSRAGVDGDLAGDDAVAAASATEVLRHRDFASLDGADRAAVARLLAAMAVVGEWRRTRRTRPGPRGPADRRRTLHRMLRAGGEPVELATRHRRERPRRVVLLVDVSGSMTAYADALLRFAHVARRAAGPATEVFTLGTRLTRVTRELSTRDQEAAMTAVAAAVPDWSGGTRLGVLVKEFLDGWGRRGVARGAVVVVLSDGWERGDPRLLATQMQQLHRLAHRVVWANPRAGRPGFAPLAAGMAAALPHVDAFVSGHSVAALEHLARVVMGGVRAEVPRYA